MGDTAFERALWAKKPEILTQFLKKKIPSGKVQTLLASVAYQNRPDLVQRLLSDGADVNAIDDESDPVLRGFIGGLLWSHTTRSAEERERGFQALELILKAGAKWSPDERHMKWLRRDLAAGESKIVIRLLDLLHKYVVFTPEQFHELTRTPAVRKVLNGISKPRREPFGAYYPPPPPPVTPPFIESPRRGYWKRHWSRQGKF